MDCKHCDHGYFHREYGHWFGDDVECVNGVLIDIDVAREGRQTDVLYPVAPCHPMWREQQAGEPFDNDCQARLDAWAALGEEP